MTSKIDDGGAAYPMPDQRDPVTGAGIMQGSYGLTKRDYFAAAALPAVIANCASDQLMNGESREQMFARKALWVAEALIAASKSEARDG